MWRKASARRIKGRRGRGARRSFSASSNAGAKFTPSPDWPTPQSRSRAGPGPDSWRGGPVGLGYGRVGHSRNEFADGAVHVNGGFRGLAEVRLAKFKGLPRRAFHLRLKETGTTMPTGPAKMPPAKPLS